MRVVEMPVPALLLGEGPLWSVDDDRLYWVDQRGRRIYAASPDGSDVKRWDLPMAVGAVALRRFGGLLVAAEDGLSLLDLTTGARDVFADPEAAKEHVVLNDGGVDATGRFLVGSIDHDAFAGVNSVDEIAAGRASLFRVEADLSVEELEADFRCVNGPCWSPDEQTFYFSDTLAGTVYAARWNTETGSYADRRVFIPSAAGIMPDGAAVDDEGGYWCACVGGGQVRRYTPAGELDRVIDLPDRMVTSVAFGGAGLASLFVTSLTYPLNPDRPAGRLFRVDETGLRGMPAHAFAG